MFLKRHWFCVNQLLKLSRRRFHINKIQLTKVRINYDFLKCDQTLSDLIKKHDTKIIYSSFINSCLPSLNYKRNAMLQKKDREQNIQLQSIQPLPIALKYLENDDSLHNSLEDVKEEHEEIRHIYFPYGDEGTVPVFSEDPKPISSENKDNLAVSISKEVKKREDRFKDVDFRNWMTDYENYGEQDNEKANSWEVNYGTPNPRLPISNVPCGGCGALLHCQDPAIPGYIPSEIYKNSMKREGVHLKTLICQRCHFLKNYDIALQVRVLADDYPKVLEPLKYKPGIVILVVDLLDFPCSIWPSITNVLGTNKSMVVVGNKVDLLPRDSRGYLHRIQQTFKESIFKTMGKEASAKIRHIALISAKTGWGIEELITKLQNLRRIPGDVYIVGCTNVGKSSLFNCLLQSDYCRVQAVDLVQRATTSVWPGTTLNLLKFPILRPSGWRLYVRTKRLQYMNKIKAAEEKLRKVQLSETRNIKYNTLIGHIDRTFMPDVTETESDDVFTVSGSSTSSGKTKIGLNENHPMFATSKWCYDTPGVVQPDQIIHLLTTEELMLTLPRQLIRAKTFGIRVKQTLFIAGIGRLDYCEGPNSIRITVFCSEDLPLTMCSTEDADDLYTEFVGTDLFQVPKGSDERMSKWPGLKASDQLKLTGIKMDTSCGDIVLSNAGWVAVSSYSETEMIFKAWTPEACGIYLRKSLLPRAVTLRGKKYRHSPAYNPYKMFVPH